MRRGGLVAWGSGHSGGGGGEEAGWFDLGLKSTGVIMSSQQVGLLPNGGQGREGRNGRGTRRFETGSVTDRESFGAVLSSPACRTQEDPSIISITPIETTDTTITSSCIFFCL